MSFGIPGLDVPDPLAGLGLGGLSGGGGRRPAAYPALDEEEAQSALGALGHASLSTLGYVGSTLDKTFGGRSVRALIDTLAGSGKHARDILSVLPFTETLGITSPEEEVSPSDLVKNVTGYDPSRGNWAARNLIPFAVGMGTDPSTILGGVGALTRAGKAAELAGRTVPRFWQKGFTEAVRAGERTAIHGLRGPTVARGLEAVGTGLGRVNEALRAVPGVAAAEDILAKGAETAQTWGRGLFSAPHGFSTDPLIQTSRAAILHPGEEAADVIARGTYAELGGRQRALVAGGLDPDQLDRYLRQKAEIKDLPETRHFFDPEFVGTMSPAQRVEADAIAAEMGRRGGQAALETERAAGYAGPELADPTINYTSRQRNLTTPQGAAPQRDWLGRAKAMPVDLGKERLEALTGRPGGTIELEDILHTEGMTGPTARPLQGQIREIIRQDLGLPPTAEFSPLHHLFGGSVLDTPAQRTQELLGGHSRELLAEHLGLPPTAAPPPFHPEFGDPLAGAPVQFSKYTAPAAQSAEELAKLARAIPGERLFTPTGERIPYFKPDLAAATALRQQRAGRAATTADTIIDVIGKAQVPPAPTGTVAVPNVLKSLKLDTEVGYRRALDALGADPEAILAEAFPQAPGAKALSNQEILGKALEAYHLPEGTAQGMTDLLQRYTTPHEWGPIGKFLQNLTGTTKRGLYSIWGPSHARNYESGVLENLKDFGLKPFTQPYSMTEKALLGEAVDTKIPLFAGLSAQAQREALLNLAYTHRIIGAEAGELGGRIAPFTGSPLAPRQSAVDILKETAQGLTKGEWRNPLGAEVVDPVTGQVTKDAATLVKMGQNLNKVVEERVRLAPFAYLLQKGYTPEMAARKIFATHYDYERGVSEFMKNVGSQALLFPTFTSQNIPKQFLQAIESPAKQMATIRFAGAMNPEDQGVYTPEYLKEGGLAVPLPSEGLPAGQQRFLTKLGLPMEEAFGHLRVGAGPLSTLAKTGQGFLSMVNPALKLPLEFVTGRQLHTGRELQDLHAGTIESLGGVLPPAAASALSELAAASPASRLLSTANRLLDPRKMSAMGELGNLAGMASGLRVSDVDTEKWASIDAMNQVKEMMAGSPHLRKAVDYYVPQAEKANLTPDELEQMRLLNTLKARSRAANKQRKLGVQTLSQSNM